MKVQLNVVTNFNGASLRPGNEIDVPLNVAQRWITKGIAHPAKVKVEPIEPVKEVKVKKSVKVKKAKIAKNYLSK
jgi:hypothetical protein